MSSPSSLAAQETKSQRLRKAVKRGVARFGSALEENQFTKRCLAFDNGRLGKDELTFDAHVAASRAEASSFAITAGPDGASEKALGCAAEVGEEASHFADGGICTTAECASMYAMENEAVDMEESAALKGRAGGDPRSLRQPSVTLTERTAGDPHPLCCPQACWVFVGRLCGDARRQHKPRRLQEVTRDTVDMPPLEPEESLRHQLSVAHGISFDETSDLHAVAAEAPVVGVAAMSRVASATVSRTLSRMLFAAPARPNFHGRWVCTDTWGLDEFLAGLGVSKLQRIAASRAPWPSWEFRQDGDRITFINMTAFGKLTEDFTVGGPEYEWMDAKKQTMTCKAFWQSCSLVIEKAGPQGRFREHRHINADGLLQFLLTSLETKHAKVSWGRTFKRQGRK